MDLYKLSWHEEDTENKKRKKSLKLTEGDKSEREKELTELCKRLATISNKMDALIE
jgi:hypothetical protein